MIIIPHCDEAEPNIELMLTINRLLTKEKPMKKKALKAQIKLMAEDLQAKDRRIEALEEHLKTQQTIIKPAAPADAYVWMASMHPLDFVNTYRALPDDIRVKLMSTRWYLDHVIANNKALICAAMLRKIKCDALGVPF